MKLILTALLLLLGMLSFSDAKATNCYVSGRIYASCPGCGEGGRTGYIGSYTQSGCAGNVKTIWVAVTLLQAWGGHTQVGYGNKRCNDTYGCTVYAYGWDGPEGYQKFEASLYGEHTNYGFGARNHYDGAWDRPYGYF